MNQSHLQVREGTALVVYARPECVLSQVPRQVLLDTLSEAERAKVARFMAKDDSDLYLTAHALTRCLLARLLGAVPSALEFQVSERGRPELAGDAAQSGIRFNLSHTRGLAACGVTLRSAIGVDAEHITRKVDLSGVGKRVFSTRELAGLHALGGDAQRQRFFDLWTLKEAYVKATGKGLASPLRSVTIAAEAPDPVPVSFADPSLDRAAGWCLRRFPVPPAHTLALALDAVPSAQVTFCELRSEELLP
mgnify:CR=1 FL=1